jgi:hypothetical protein
MECRGKSYSVVQGIEPNLWKWKVQPDEKTTVCGEGRTGAAAVNSAVWRVDKALAKQAKRSAAPPRAFARVGCHKQETQSDKAEIVRTIRTGVRALTTLKAEDGVES